MLAYARKEYRAQLRADFREYYSISFDASYANSRVETADLVVGLPAGSRTMSAIDPKASWGWNEALLAQIWNLLSAYIFYQDPKNKHKDAPKVEPPKKKVEKQQVADTDGVKEILKRKRKEG